MYVIGGISRSVSIGRDRAVLVVSVLTVALLLASGLAVVHHDCHADEDGSCAICYYAIAPGCLPEASQVPVSPVVERRAVPPSSAHRPDSKSLCAAAPRGPPLESA